MRRFIRIADALKAAVAGAAGLPALDAADIELAIFWIHARPHDAGIEFQIERYDATLGNFFLSDLFVHHFKEGGFSVAGVEEVIGERAEARIAHEALPARRIVLVHRNPADGRLEIFWNGN